MKDNIDVAGIETTAGCPAFGSVPAASATAVDHLAAAGAIVTGKTNLDQFATGLVGTRSPYGTPRNPFDPAVVPGGSSSGSGVAVAAGLVPFALGTDTAGSGRVPAAFGNIVGCKPTLGLVSTVGRGPRLPVARLRLGVRPHRPRRGRSSWARWPVPTPPTSTPVRSRDRRQRTIAAPDDIVVGVPDDSILARCDPEIVEMFEVQRKELAHLGVRLRQVDLGPFLDVGDLLYDGPWLAERDAAIGGFLDAHRIRGPPRDPRHHHGRETIQRDRPVPGRVPATGVGAASVDRLGRTSMRSCSHRCRPSRRWRPSRPTPSASTPGSGCSRRSSTCSTSAPWRSPAACSRPLDREEGCPSVSRWWRRPAPTGSSSTWPTGTNGWSTAHSAQRAPGSGRPRRRSWSSGPRPCRWPWSGPISPASH